MLLTVIAAVYLAAGADAALHQLANRLTERSTAVHSIEINVEVETHPTEKFLVEYAEDTKVAFADAKRRFDGRMVCRLRTRTAAEFYADIQRFSFDGRQVSDSVVSFDGHRRWFETRHNDANYSFSEIVVGNNLPVQYESIVPHLAAIDMIRPVGFSALLGSAILTNDNTVVMGRETIEGKTYTTIRFNEATPYLQRSTLWFDIGRGYAVRKIRKEAFRNEKWRVTDCIDVTKYERIETDRGMTIWLPATICMEVYNSRSEMTSFDVASIEVVSINRPWSASDFRPEITVGTTMRDADTGRVWVHGGRPTPAIEEAVRRSVEDSKRQLADAGPVANLITPRDPTKSILRRMGPALFAGTGAALLLLAICLQTTIWVKVKRWCLGRLC